MNTAGEVLEASDSIVGTVADTVSDVIDDLNPFGW